MAATKRTILEGLKRNRLLQIADGEGVELPERRALDPIRETLSRQRSLKVDQVLAYLSRDELNAVCRALGLDDGGRAKAEIAARILASNGAPSDSAAQPTPRRTKNVVANSNGSAGAKLTLQRLESHLWASADILRGSIDAADFKNYLFGLLFLKRLSDVFEEEAEHLQEDEGYDEELAWEDPDEHRFFVPKRARWSTLRKATTDVGAKIDKAVAALEDANPELEGIFGGYAYNDKDKLTDDTLVALFQHFSKIRLRNSDLSDPDVLGRAYEYLIAQFASSAGKKGGEFYTPREVVQLLVRILKPKEGMRIYDPCAGSGGMLIQTAAHLRENGKDPKKLSLFGQERNVGTWAICKMNLFLHDLGDAQIAKGDTLRDPKLLEGGALRVFDRVISNPPFSLKKWGGEALAGDPYGRFRFGLPPASYGDLAFVQHMLASTNKTGMVGTVMPHGVLFRGGQEQIIREGLIKEDVIEAVVGLAPNLFYGTGIPACLLILNRNKPSKRRGKVLFVYGAGEAEERLNKNVLTDANIERLSKAFHAFEDEDRFSQVVDREEIVENDYNLNITRYVDVAEDEERIDVAAELAKLRELEQERAEAEKVMYGYLAELGYE